MGLMATLIENYAVQPFKIGPDYIDPGYHTAATGRISRNLDSWMVPAEQVLATFSRASRGAEIAIIEGVMGLYDGFEAKTEEGSSAQVAKLLKAPVILVMDVGKMARSAGALALGYRAFDPTLNLAGVICNRVGSPTHARWVTESVNSVGIPVLGCIPKSEQIKIPERHLGLHMAHERQVEVQNLLDVTAALFQEHIDLDRIWEVARTAGTIEINLPAPQAKTDTIVRIAVARDEAFCFYYEDNLDLLRAAGAEIVFFSPLKDAALPEDVSGIYLGGGYPELCAEKLATNTAIKAALVRANATRMPIYAECGGLMYLTESITDSDGLQHPMVGLLPGHSAMANRPTMGYRQVTAEQDTLLLRARQSTRGHEFHYSNWVTADHFAYCIAPRVGRESRLEGYTEGNLLASYVHLHFGANPHLAVNFVQASSHWQKDQTLKSG